MRHSKMTRREVIDKISEVMKSYPDAETYIYGSEARGEARADSDIDILILLPDTLTTRERIQYEDNIHGSLFGVEMKTDVEISPLILQHKVWNTRITPFTLNVVHDRIRL